MPNTCKFLAATPTNLDTFVTARLYPASRKAPMAVQVHTHCSAPNPQLLRFACVESVLDDSAVQSHVHDIAVTVRDGPNTSHFRVFFKRHVLLPASKSLRIQGDLLVMRVASRNEHSVVNMRAGDCRLSAFVTRKIAKHIRKFQKPQRARMPRHVKLEWRW
ncbi:hypothetical protein B0H14DRAFT_3483164 [Mycena olivaceomarginata]|nr:hypothetical protein B0H14DRAFT_3483164 [Mycena olivaceomarginata]